MPGKPEPTPPPALVDKNDVSLVARNMISARMRFQQLSPSGFCANSVGPLLQCLLIEPFTLSVIWSCSPSLFASLKRHSSSSENHSSQLRTRQERNLERTLAIICEFILYEDYCTVKSVSIFLKFLLKLSLEKHNILKMMLITWSTLSLSIFSPLCIYFWWPLQSVHFEV